MALKAGWEAGPGGGNMVKNTATGQVLDVNHPLYQQAADGPQQSVEQGGGVQAAQGPITNQQDVAKTTATVGGSTAQGAPTTVAQSFQQALVNRLNPQAMSASDPSIAPAIQANSLAESRGFDRNRAMLAERAAANGQDMSGGFETNLLGLAQDRAGREGQFAGNAVMQGQQAQDANTRSAMGMAGSLLSGNAGLSQQADLANLDAALRREGMTMQGNLGQWDLSLRRDLGNNANNLSLLSLLMNNDQFGRSLGQNNAQFGAGLDQQGLLALLAGL